MKKYIQNILAQNSTGEIMYICGKCGAEVEKEAKICPKCNARLGKIKCPFCNFTGDIDDFKNDTCPRCGRKKTEKKKESKQLLDKHRNLTFSKKLFWILFFSLTLVLFLLILIILYHYNII